MIVRQHWKPEPDAHDYPAAHDFLTLVVAEPLATNLIDALQDAPLVHRKAKDLLRASMLPLLADTNVHVARDLAKIHKGERLSPVLLVRGDASVGAPLVIADGYHRICASRHVDEDADIPCRLVGWPHA
jgi:hypothetical protein